MPRPTHRELEFPGIKVAARPAAGWNGTRDRGETRALAAVRDDRSGNKWLCRLRSRPHRSNFGGTQRAIGLGEGKGDRGEKGGAGLPVPCAQVEQRYAASESARHRLCPQRATCSSLGHRRFSLPARRSLWDPLGPPDPGELLAGCNFRRAARSEKARPGHTRTRD